LRSRFNQPKTLSGIETAVEQDTLAVKRFNQPKTLSGIETHCPFLSLGNLLASTNLKPFQGLKHEPRYH